MLASMVLIASLLYLVANILNYFTHRDTKEKRLLRDIEILLKIQQLSDEDRSQVINKYRPKSKA